MYTFLIEIIF